ncbi:hypothetical protein G6F37_004801 [Rhizopus arrhizus]|nr:hypothetical protein G6F38_006162 [Rhizopus arrhizus]KAG1159541.1 hypothetical protein G6F37_004801 [Rhizopus arrhizus]
MPTVKQLQAEYATDKAEINRLQPQNAFLLERLAQTSTTTASTRDSTAAVFRPPASPSCQAAAASTFYPPSTNRGLKYLYLPVQRRLPISQLHSFLQRLNISSNKSLFQ